MGIAITPTGLKLALLDGMKAEEERTEQRQIAAITDEMSILITERKAA